MTVLWLTLPGAYHVWLCNILLVNVQRILNHPNMFGSFFHYYAEEKRISDTLLYARLRQGSRSTHAASVTVGGHDIVTDYRKTRGMIGLVPLERAFFIPGNFPMCRAQWVIYRRRSLTDLTELTGAVRQIVML